MLVCDFIDLCNVWVGFYWLSFFLAFFLFTCHNFCWVPDTINNMFLRFWSLFSTFKECWIWQAVTSNQLDPFEVFNFDSSGLE